MTINDQINYKKEGFSDSRKNIKADDDKNINSSRFIKSLKIKCEIEEIFVHSEITLDVQNAYGQTAKVFIPLSIADNSIIYYAKATQGNKDYELQYFSSFQAAHKNIPPVNVIISKINDGILQILIDELQNDEKITIKLHTIEMLKQKGNYYEFMLPNGIDPGLMKNEFRDVFDVSYCLTDEHVYDFVFDIIIKSAYRIHKIECLSHDIDIDKNDDFVRINSKNNFSPKDGNLFFRYYLKNRPETILYSSQKSDHFLIENTNRIQIEDEFSPKEYFFLIDISENFGENNLSLQKEMLSAMLSKLHEIDKFNIIFFSSSYYLFSKKSVFASNENITKALDLADNLKTFGTVNLENAMKYSSEIVSSPGYKRNYILFSNFVFSREKISIDSIINYVMQNKIFLICTGNSFNLKFAEEISSRTLSECFILPSSKAIRDLTKELQKYINSCQISEVLIDMDKQNVSDIIEHKGGTLLSEKTLYIPGKFYDNKFSKPRIIYNIQNKEHTNNSCDVRNISLSRSLSIYYANEKINQLKMDFTTKEASTEIKDIQDKHHILNKSSFLAIKSVAPSKYSINEFTYQKIQLPYDIYKKTQSKIFELYLQVDNRFFNKKDDVQSKKKTGSQKKIFFDDTIEKESDVDIIHQHHVKIYLAVYIGSKKEENKINKEINKRTHQLKSGIKYLIRKGLPPKGVIHFETHRNQENQIIFSNISPTFNYIEYDRSVYGKFEEILFDHIQSLKEKIIKPGQNMVWLLEYDL